MFCKRLLLLLVYVYVGTSTLQVIAGDERLLVSPESVVAPKGSNATFDCTATSDITWGITLPQTNGSRQLQVGDDDFHAFLFGRGIFAPFPMPNISRVTILGSSRNNGTGLECLVGFFSPERSEVVTAIFYGEPSPPTNLTLTPLLQRQGVLITWNPGFVLNGEEVVFIVISHNLDSNQQRQSRVNGTSYILTPPFESGTCPRYNITVYSENGFSRSLSGVSNITLLPSAPSDLEADSITTTTSLQAGPAVTFSFNAPSPCLEYRVDRYTLVFVEEANSFGMVPLHILNVSRFVDDGPVSLMVTSSDGLLPGRQYNTTITAFNQVGSSESSLIVYTTDLQSSRVEVDFNSLNVDITCSFASGASALGCLVSIGVSFQVNVTRDPPNADVATDSVSVPANLSNQVMVTVVEILSDGSFSSIVTPTFVTLIQPTSPPAATSYHFTSTEEVNETSLPTFQMTTDPNNLAGDTLYIIIGVVAGVVVLLFFIIVIVMCAICRHIRKKKRDFRSLRLAPGGRGDELKSNYMYGERGSLPHLADPCDPPAENGRHVRSNTYDFPHPEAANGCTTPSNPTYETVQSAKKEMRTASGPAIPNPVYGPTGSSNTPSTSTSPPPPLKSTPNPVYSETRVLTTTFSSNGSAILPDISGLNPVYAAIDKPDAYPQPAKSDPGPAQYANQQSVPQPHADTVAYPMYEELKGSKTLESAEGGVPMMRNESYGLVGMGEVGASSARPRNTDSNTTSVATLKETCEKTLS